MPIRRIEGATPAPVIDVNGKKVTLWNHGTTADGVDLTVRTLRPICEAINEGYDDLSGWCDSLSSKLDTVSSNLDIVSGDLITEKERSITKDNNLQDQIDTLKAATDVIMVYGTYADFTANSASPSLGLTDADVIKVLRDETTNDEQVYYQWYDPASGHEWTGWSGIGSLDPYYSKTEIDNNFLSAKGAVLTGKNIVITEVANQPKIKIATKDDVIFDTVSATNISADLFKSQFGTVDTWQLKFNSANGSYLTATEANVLQLTANTLYGQSNNSNVDSLISSAEYGQFAYNVINSAKFSAVGTTTSTAFISGGFGIEAGQGVGVSLNGKNVVITAEGTTYNAGDYISTANKTISVTGNLIGSAQSGQSALNWITGQSATLYPGPGIQFYSAATNKLGIKVSAQGINGTITSIAGSALSAGANYIDGNYIEIGSDNSINLSSNIIIDYMSANSALLSANYAGEHYYNYLTPSSTRFTYGPGAATISLTGVEVSDGYSSPKNIPWTKLLDEFVLTTGNASGSKLSANTAITLVVTSQLPSVLAANTYYIV